jgi:hypothetical protein
VVVDRSGSGVLDLAFTPTLLEHGCDACNFYPGDGFYVVVRMRALLVVVVAGLVSAPPALASGWSIQPTPRPPNATNRHLVGVSCTSARACIAVGAYQTSTNASLPLAERWNGTRWSILSAPHPSGAWGSWLNSVSCSSSRACTAVGDYRTSQSGQPTLTLAERWDGRSWSIQPTPTPTGKHGGVLRSVSCPSSQACTAVGSIPHQGAPLAEHWDGTSWSVQPAPHNYLASVLLGVSCPSEQRCTGVGWQYYEQATTLAERWDGTSWSIQGTPGRGYTSTLGSVSCPSEQSCTAVGWRDGSDEPVTLAEHWGGTNWSIQRTPNGSGDTSNELHGISCPNVQFCTAVGVRSDGGHDPVTLALHWNGAKWSIQTTPVPEGAHALHGGFLSVSCPSIRTCTAVGHSKLKGTTATLAERWRAG